ncbi:hypothetical protein RYX36_004842, partial [Vicia faba]
GGQIELEKQRGSTASLPSNPLTRSSNFPQQRSILTQIPFIQLLIAHHHDHPPQNTPFCNPLSATQRTSPSSPFRLFLTNPAPPATLICFLLLTASLTVQQLLPLSEQATRPPSPCLLRTTPSDYSLCSHSQPQLPHSLCSTFCSRQ